MSQPQKTERDQPIDAIEDKIQGREGNYALIARYIRAYPDSFTSG